MSKVYQTLRKKNDTSVEVYPNIEPDENIPSSSIDGVKLKTKTITGGKIADGTISGTKLQNGAVKTINIDLDAVTGSEIASRAISLRHLDVDIEKSLLCLDYTYNMFMGDEFDETLVFIGTTTLSNVINDYSQSEIDSALDFDKNQADYISTDLAILKMIIDGIGEGLTNDGIIDIRTDDFTYMMYKYDVDKYVIRASDWLDNVIFKLEFNGSTLTILDYVNTEYIYLKLYKLINKNVNFE